MQIHPYPANLGIIVETSYENMIQATVPVTNLAAIASDENVKFIRMPAMAVPGLAEPGMPDAEPKTNVDSSDMTGTQTPDMQESDKTDTSNALSPYLFSIPAIAAVAGFLVWKRRTPKKKTVRHCTF